MTQGRMQIAPQIPGPMMDKRVITISRSQRPTNEEDGDDPLLINVLRRRWMLLSVCMLLSLIAGGLVASRFRMPKAVTTGQLRYTALPPTLQGIYTAPQTLELVEIMMSNEKMAELAQRCGLQIDPKVLRERFQVEAKRYSNIIDVELRWKEGKQSIDMVNTLMRIACETTAASRKETLSQYEAETNLQYAASNERVVQLRDKVLQLRQQRQARLNGDGLGGENDVKRLMDRLAHTEDEMDQLTLERVSLNRQLATLKSEVETVQGQIRQELIKGRRQQVASRKRIWSPNSDKYVQLEELEKELDVFVEENQLLDYVTWRAKLETVGSMLIGELDPASLAAVTVLERRLAFNESKIEEVEFKLLPMDSTWTTLENQRESLERRLADALGSSDVASTELDEAEAQLDEAMEARSKLLDHVNAIRRGSDTEFSEMGVLTPASWQTTEMSEGKLKLFVFTFSGCFFLLVLPVFALEHFFPSGDPADAAAKAIGVPRVSRGTFLSQRVSGERRQLHPVNSEAMRLLALRIQQSVPGAGSLVLFSGLNHEKSAIPMISYLAECLARREERVLIIDACDRPQDSRSRSMNEDSVNSMMANGQSYTTNVSTTGAAVSDASLPANVGDVDPSGLIGLSDFLNHANVSPDDMICPTSIPGVDIISSGSSSFPSEGLASSSLTTLLGECRQRYTMILVAGPSTNHPSDLQMMSARADGILFTVPPTGRFTGNGEEVVKDLLGMGAPVIGIVS
ncbi:MAG: hypothetical protein KDA92_02045 [Planctomycetales bacterium]|nr:hypothetical protein [Planctomycetales bacterium]